MGGGFRCGCGVLSGDGGDGQWTIMVSPPGTIKIRAIAITPNTLPRGRGQPLYRDGLRTSDREIATAALQPRDDRSVGLSVTGGLGVAAGHARAKKVLVTGLYIIV